MSQCDCGPECIIPGTLKPKQLNGNPAIINIVNRHAFPTVTSQNVISEQSFSYVLLHRALLVRVNLEETFVVKLEVVIL